MQYDDGIHPYTMGDAPPSIYDPHMRPVQNIPHHSPHMNHGMHQYHPGNHVTPVSNHVMGSVPDVHKRDKDAIYGWVNICPGSGRLPAGGDLGYHGRQVLGTHAPDY